MNDKIARANNCFLSGFSCSQAVLSNFSEDYGLDNVTALKLACAFGGGIAQMAETCGAVTGAFMVIGLKYGRTTLDDLEAKEKTYAVVHQFVTEFKRRNKAIVCRELIGYDMSNENEKRIIQEKELTKILCPKFVQDAVEILEHIL